MPRPEHEQLIKRSSLYYSERFAEHGPTARGADWNSVESQMLRFDRLLTIAAGRDSFSLIDYGCGTGALLKWLDTQTVQVDYQGYDPGTTMVDHARGASANRTDAVFVSKLDELVSTDFVVASGVFNVKLTTAPEVWEEYLFEEIARLDQLAQRGFAFNLLTSYSDPERMRDDLYYGDPLRYFDHCKRLYSRDIALLHDYGLYEFTILVRKDIR